MFKQFLFVKLHNSEVIFFVFNKIFVKSEFKKQLVCITPRLNILLFPSRPVAEVPPFSSESTSVSENQKPAVEIRAKHSPVRDKLDKIRRSLTEPLIQYFHDLQSSPDNEEESEVLNTPKSVIPDSNSNRIGFESNSSRTNSKIDITTTTTKPKSRNNLFSENSAKDLQADKPPQMMVTDM